MRAEYQFILDDFEREVSAIIELANATRIGSPFSSRARITLANSLTLVLASVFEECVRQLVRVAWAERIKASQDASKFPAKLRAKLWRSSFERLARQPFSDADVNARIARDRIQNLTKFCLDGDINVPLEHDISHNENNMRPGQINDLFNRIGVKNIFESGCNFPELIEYFGCQTAGQAVEKLRAEIEDFFARRNNIAHAIVFGSSDGADTIDQDIEVFRLTARVLANGADQFVEA